MDEEVAVLVKAHRRLCEHYANSGLKFTLDGKLVGDLAEVIAAKLFGLKLCEKRTAGVDGHARDGRSVQVNVGYCGCMSGTGAGAASSRSHASDGTG